MSNRKPKRNANKTRSRRDLIAVAAIAAIVIVVTAVAIRTSGPWVELRSKYPGPDVGDYRFARDTVELRSADRLGVAVHRDIVAIDWGESALSLGMRNPLGWFFRPLRIPTTAIASCEQRRMSGAWTGIELWVDEAEIGIGLPRYDERAVLAWCGERGIRMIGEKSAAQ